MSGVWAFLGGLAGIARMIAAGAIVAVSVSAYFLWTVIPQREAAARSGYVLLSRATTAEATAAELAKQIKAQGIVIEAYQLQYKNALEQQAQDDADAEARIAEYEAKLKAAGVDDGLTADDYNFIMRNQSGAKTAPNRR